MQNKKTFFYILMHLGFLLYSCYALLGKFASEQDFLSKNFILLYLGVLFVMFVYAILWQQILKHISLTIAVTNKAITIFWGIIFGKLFFGESIKPTMIIGSLLIISGIVILSLQKDQKSEDEISCEQ